MSKSSDNAAGKVVNPNNSTFWNCRPETWYIFLLVGTGILLRYSIFYLIVHDAPAFLHSFLLPVTVVKALGQKHHINFLLVGTWIVLVLFNILTCKCLRNEQHAYLIMKSEVIPAFICIQRQQRTRRYTCKTASSQIDVRLETFELRFASLQFLQTEIEISLPDDPAIVSGCEWIDGSLKSLVYWASIRATARQWLLKLHE